MKSFRASSPWKWGEKIGRVSWFSAIRAASNYVRHSDDWKWDARQLSDSQIEDLDWVIRSDTKQNLIILRDLGLKLPRILEKKTSTKTLVDKLELMNADVTNRRISAWVEEAKKNLGDKK